MTKIATMFVPYIQDRFPVGAEIKDNGAGTLLVLQKLEQAVDGRRYAQEIAIRFRRDVLDEFKAAIDADNVPRQDRIGDRVDEIVGRRLEVYDPLGPQAVAFVIDLGGEALDR